MRRTATAPLHINFAISPVALVALLLALLFWFSTSPIVGFSRGGEDDEGSGIGGTGLIPVPSSESGLGGTGFRPFVGMTPAAIEPGAAAAHRENAAPQTAAISISLEHPAQGSVAPVQSSAQNGTAGSSPLEVIALLESRETIAQSKPVLDAPLPRPVEVIAQRDLTIDSGPVLITEQIQRDIDSNAGRLAAAANTVTAPSAVSSSRSALPGATQDSYGHAIAEQQPPSRPVANFQEDSQSAADSRGSAPKVSPSAVDTEPSWYDLAALISDHQTGADSTGSKSGLGQDRPIEAIDALVDETARAGLPGKRPSRLRRPELPAVQTARPPQRVTILPPRIRPLGL